MRNAFLLLTLTLFLIVPLKGQSDLKKLDQLIEKARNKWSVPGLSVAIVKDGKVYLSKGYGVMVADKTQKVDEETLFAIASNTKGFLSSAIATLVTDGKLKWDDKVIDYLPYFRLYDSYVTQEVTIRDLLSHRVGLGTYSGDAIWYKSEMPAEEIVKLTAKVPQAYPFRAGYGYSNLMFIAAGEVVKAVTGKTWDEYVNEKFFVPLEMKRTIASTDLLDTKGNYAMPHKTELNVNYPIDWVNWDNMSAAGAIISSSDDMSNWMIMHLNRGVFNGNAILELTQQNELWTIHNSFKISEESKKDIPGRHFSGYGLGFGLQDYFGRMVVSHGGGYDGMYSRVMMIPDENLGIAILTNSMSGITRPLAYQIANYFIKEDTKDWTEAFYKPQVKDERIVALQNARDKATSPTLDLKKYAGDYFADMYGKISIVADGPKLKLLFSNSPKLNATLKHWHHDTWEIQWDKTHAWFGFGLLNFQLNDQLGVSGMKFNVPNGDIFFDEYDIVKIVEN